MSNGANKQNMKACTHHVERLEDLTLVTRAITVQGEGTVLLAHVLLGETHTGSNRDLSSDDTVASKEGRGEDVHGTTLSVGHADLATEELANDTLDSATTHDGEGMAAVSSDDAVLLADSVLEANRNSFLFNAISVRMLTQRNKQKAGSEPGQWPNGRTHGLVWPCREHQKPFPYDAWSACPCTSATAQTSSPLPRGLAHRRDATGTSPHGVGRGRAATGRWAFHAAG